MHLQQKMNNTKLERKALSAKHAGKPEKR